MTWIVESPAQSGYVFVFSPVAAGGNNAPVVTPPADITLQFAAGGAGLSKSNAQLLAWIATASATDIEDGALAVTADLSPLADPIPAGTYTITFTSAQDTSGLTGSATAQLTVQEAVAVNDPPAVTGNYPQQSATVGVPFTFNASVNFSDPGDVLTYSLATPVTGIAIDGATGMVTTTFADAGGLTLEIMATDAVGQTATALLPIVVSDAPTLTGQYLVMTQASIKPDDAMYIGNDLVLTCTLNDDAGNAVVAGTVTLTIKDSNGQEVDGLVWPLSFTHLGAGAWYAVVDAALAAQFNGRYAWEIKAASDGLDGFWKKVYTATFRDFE